MVYTPFIYLDRVRMSGLQEAVAQSKLFRLIPEIGHLAPIIITGGALFISLVTINYPLLVLAGSTVEAGLFYSLLRNLSDYIITPTFGLQTASEVNNKRPECSSYFQTLTASRFRLLMGDGIKNTFPNYPIYFIVFAIVYCIQGLLFYSNECSQLGPAYSNRPYMSIIGGCMFFILYALYFFVYGCDSLFSIVMTVILAATVSYLIAQQNVLLFGRESVNLLYIPTLGQRTGMDYVCVTTKATNSS